MTIRLSLLSALSLSRRALDGRTSPISMGMAKKNKLKHELMPSRPMGSATNGPEQDGALVAVV